MQNKCYAVLDTNVLVSALLGASRMSVPTMVLRAVTEGKIIPLYNDAIIDEYREVLSRDKFPFCKDQIVSVLETIMADGICLDETKTIDEILPDPKDVVFYEVAMSAECAYLVTGNIKHFPKKPFVVTPAEMMHIVESLEHTGMLSEPNVPYGHRHPTTTGVDHGLAENEI